MKQHCVSVATGAFFVLYFLSFDWTDGISRVRRGHAIVGRQTIGPLFRG
ncbi:MAG: hypothetical protein L0Z50_08005 [Verrucomicrobiales bacterium]|nr:hypothetical protein [Verrucomicrobiales bacterium]